MKKLITGNKTDIIQRKIQQKINPMKIFVISQHSSISPTMVGKSKSQVTSKPLNMKLSSKSKIHPAREFLRIFGEKCSVHGIRYLVEDDLHWTERLTWLALITAATFGVMYVSFLLSQRYNTSPLSTVVESTYYHISEIPYPGVSICNFNRINYKKVNAAIERYLPNVTDDAKFTFRLLLEKLKTVDFGSFDELESIADRNFTELNYLNITAVWEFVMHRCEDMLLQCWWRIRYINCCEFFSLQKTEYGLCYSFNSGTSAESPFINRSAPNWPWRVSSYGEWSGLWISVDVMTDTKAPSNKDPPGIVALIHHPFEWPTIGNFIPTGSTTSIAITPTTFYSSPDVRRFTPDQRQCIYEDEVNSPNIMHMPGLPYLRPNCIARCRQNYMMKYCHCVFDVYYPTTGEFPLCNISGLVCMAFYNAGDIIFLDIFNNEKPLEKSIYFDPNETGMECSCLQECSRIEYGIEIQPNLNTNGNKEKVVLNIFFKTQTMLRYRKDVMFGWLDLLVAFGGVIGLCLGASLLSLAEIAYYLTVGLFWGIKRYNGKQIPYQSNKINQKRIKSNFEVKWYP